MPHHPPIIPVPNFPYHTFRFADICQKLFMSFSFSEDCTISAFKRRNDQSQKNTLSRYIYNFFMFSSLHLKINPPCSAPLHFTAFQTRNWTIVRILHVSCFSNICYSSRYRKSITKNTKSNDVWIHLTHYPDTRFVITKAYY